jgi:BASS family bile acid:Na+ symporter
MKTIQHFIHKHLLGLLLAMYAIAIYFPGPGNRIRELHLWHIQSGPQLTLPMLMLAFLLFSAGLGIRTSEVKNVSRSLQTILAGLLANLVIPLIFVALCALLGKVWHSNRELQIMLVGLAVIGSMPIAGSSATWAQNSEGNLTISLGLVVFSTLFSPVTSPIGFRVSSLLTQGEYSQDLSLLSRGSTTQFLILSVAIPSILGIGIRLAFGEKRIRALASAAKFFALLDLLVLNYSNAAVALPQAFRKPDYDFLALLICVTTLLCIIGFGGGLLVARFLKIDGTDRASLVYGLGMNNNGTGLVLVTSQLGNHPMVLLPIILFNLEQQIIAAAAGTFLMRRHERRAPAPQVAPAVELASVS